MNISNVTSFLCCVVCFAQRAAENISSRVREFNTRIEHKFETALWSRGLYWGGRYWVHRETNQSSVDIVFCVPCVCTANAQPTLAHTCPIHFPMTLARQ